MHYFEIFFILFLLGFIFWVSSHLYSSIFHVPYVNSSKETIYNALRLSGLKKGDTLVDLGCGRGDALIIASRDFDAKSFGFEISPLPYLLAKIKILVSGQSKNCQVTFGDFKNAEPKLKDSDVIYLYLFNSTLKRIEKWLFGHIRAKTKIVTLAFSFSKHKPIKVIETKNLGRETKVSLYIK